jgi:TPR repeat protein
MNEIYKEKSASDRAMELKAKIILANLGDSDAQNEIGLAYETGDHVQQDFDKAIEWHKLAAEQGNSDSMFRLGRIWQYGLSGDSEFSIALKWYRMAADKGNSSALFNIGTLYLKGEGVSQDYNVAREMLELSAAKGDSDALHNLAYIYAQGLGVERNDEKALNFQLLAAEQGNKESQNILGWRYKDGDGVLPSDEEAYKWFYAAAAQGHVDAQCTLGWILLQGEGVNEDVAEGIKWLQSSADKGNNTASEILKSNSMQSKIILHDLLTLKPMVDESDDGTRWLMITVEELLWRDTSVVTFGGVMRKTEKIECNTNEISDCSNLINRGFDEIQISRGSQSDGDDIILVPGDKVIIDWRSQQYQDQSFRGEWRMTYHALLDGKQWGYLGDLSDYYYGENEQVKEQVKSAKINIVDLADSDEETKKWYRNMIEEDCNQQFANIPKKADDNL